MSARRLLLLAVLGVFSVAAPASAGTFDIAACSLAPAGANASWSYTTSNPVVFTGEERCANASGLRVSDTFGGPPDAAAGDTATWAITAAPGTRIRSARLRSALHVYGDAGWYAEIRADTTVLKECRLTGSLDCYAGSDDAPAQDTFNGLDAASLSIGGRCVPFGGAATCSRGASLHRLEANLLGASVTVEDQQNPTASLQPTGLANADGYITGPGALTSTAEDNTGILRREVLIDEVAVAQINAPAASTGGCGDLGQGAAYTYTQPCAGARGSNGQRSDTLDPSAWPQGAHRLSVRAVDPAQNTAVSNLANVLIDTQAPPPPVLSVPAGWQNGQAPVSVLASDPAGGSPLTSTSVTACKAGACVVATGPLVDQRATVAMPQLTDGTWQVTATVVDAVGHRSNQSGPSSLQVDRSVPTITSVTPAGQITPGTYRPSASVADETSGVASVTYAISTDGGPYEPVESFTAAAGRTYRVQVTATDRAGNRLTATGASATTPAGPGTTPTNPGTTTKRCKLTLTRARRTTTGKVLLEGAAPARTRVRARVSTGTRSRYLTVAAKSNGRYRALLRRPTRSLSMTARVTATACTTASRRVTAR